MVPAVPAVGTQHRDGRWQALVLTDVRNGCSQHCQFARGLLLYRVITTGTL